jgi:hypothetical protein
MPQGDGGAGARGKSFMRNRERHKASIICYLVLASAVHFLNVEVSLAQELSVEERWSCFLRQAVKVDSAMKRVIHHEDAETVFG